MDALSLLSAGFAKPEPQDAAGATLAPKIDRDSARIDWRREAARSPVRCEPSIPRRARGPPIEARRSSCSAAVATDERGEPGRVLAAGERLVVGCGDGALAVREVQPAGKNRLAVREWVRGRGITSGDRLG